VVALVAVLAVLALLGVNPLDIGRGSAAGDGSGIGADGSDAPGAGGPSGRPVAPPVPGHEVYGFVPYWEMDSGIAAHLADTDLTTLALFSVTHHTDGRMSTTQTGYDRITGELGRQLVSEAHERGTRVELVYTSFGEEKNRAFYGNDVAQQHWIDVLVAFVDEHDFDGINVDVEALPADLVPAYGVWVGRLREALRARLPEAQVSVATQANQRGAAMAAVAVAAGADRVFLMGYDYHWPGSQPGASAPIERLDGEERDLVWSLDRYASLGVPMGRTILGLPLYGVMWPVSGPGLGAPSLGRGDTWVPRRNLAVLTDEAFDSTYDPTESVEFYAVPADGVDPADPATLDPNAGPDDAPWTAVYFDSPRSLAPKLALANDRGLAGAGFWAIGYERGLPGYTDLINAFGAGEAAP
jgi:GH18 family chitinase